MARIPMAALATALLGPVAAAPTLSADARGPGTAVVELYTSQGCSSCPPADELLGELADEPGVIALSLHVDYWDRLGWPDPFGSAQHSRRQRDYGATLANGGRVYTPQIVVDGRRGMVGHHGPRVRAAIDAARQRGDIVRPRLNGEPPESVVVPARGEASRARVWLAYFDERHETAVERGENAGETLINHHVVRKLERLGRWSGNRARFSVGGSAARAAGRDGMAVFVQRPGPGPIIGAAKRVFD